MFQRLSNAACTHVRRQRESPTSRILDLLCRTALPLSIHHHDRPPEYSTPMPGEKGCGNWYDKHPPRVEAHELVTNIVSNSIFEHVRIRRSIYEMFEIRSPRLTVAKLIVVKNDPGAELTLISPTLYDWAKDKGILFDEIISTRAAAVSFTAGAKAEVSTAAHLHVYLPNMNIPVSLQVLRMPGMTDCVNEILLGLDNTEVLGLELSIRNRTSTYHSVPNALEPIVSMHIPFETVSRQYAGGSHIEQVRPTITGATTTFSPLPPAPTKMPYQPPAPLPPPPLPPKPPSLTPPVVDNAIASMLPALHTPAPPTPAEELKEDDSAVKVTWRPQSAQKNLFRSHSIARWCVWRHSASRRTAFCQA